MQLQGKKINFLGDSITEGVGVSAPEHRYPDLLAAKYGFTARNYGISGTRFAKQHTLGEGETEDRNYCVRVSLMDPDADAVIVFGGTNDFGHGDAPLGEMSDRTPDTFYGACHTLFESLMVKYPGKPIVILTPLHRITEDNPRGDNKPQDVAPLSTYVDIIKEVARYYSLPVLDLFAMSGIQPRVPVIGEKFCPDGLHPSDAGHVLLAERIGNFLLTL